MLLTTGVRAFNLQRLQSFTSRRNLGLPVGAGTFNALSKAPTPNALGAIVLLRICVAMEDNFLIQGDVV